MNYTSKTKKKKQTKTTLQTELNIYSNKTWGYKKKKNHLEIGIQNVQRKIRQNIMRGRGWEDLGEWH